MDIKVILFGVIFLGLVAGLFYFITLLIQKIMVKLRKNRRIRNNNIDDYTNTTQSNTINHCGINASKAILKAKKNMRSK